MYQNFVFTNLFWFSFCRQKKDIEVNYDVKRSVSQTRFVGKDSAV